MLKRLVVLFLLLSALGLILPNQARASGQVTGFFTTPNTSVPLKNSTITFTLTQAGVDVTNSYNLAGTPVSCYTSSTGAVVGLPDPQVTPTVNAQNVGGGVLSGTYYIKIAYYTGSTITSASQASTVVVSGGNNSFVVSGPSLQPQGATGYKVYAGTTLGSETLQATTAGFGSTSVSTIVSGAVLPNNNTVCSFTFNDAIIPTETKYRVNIVDVNGRQVAGFPQTWSLTGTSVNVGSVVPVANTGQVRFPSPILSTPLSAFATQSINSPVTLNGFNLTGGGLILPNNSAPPACTSGQSSIWTGSNGKLTACQNGGSSVSIIDSILNGWQVNGTDVITASLTDSVLVGLSSSDLTSQSSGANHGVRVGTFSFWVDAGSNVSGGSTNAHGLEAGVVSTSTYNGGGPAAFFGPIGTGTQDTMAPLIFVGCNGNCSSGFTEFGRLDGSAGSEGQWNFGVRAAGASEDAFAGVAHFRGSVTLSNGLTNAQVVRLAATSNYDAIYSEYTGSGSYKPLAIFTDGSETCRFDATQNFLCGTSSSDDTVGTIAEFVRTSTAHTSAAVWNSGNTTTSEGDIYVKAGTTFSTAPTGHLGVTASGYTLSGAYYPSMVFLNSDTNATNGILIDALLGPVAIRANGTTELSVTGGTGIALAHALPVTSGGLGQTSAFTANGLIYAVSTTAAATSSSITFDATNKWFDVIGNILAQSKTVNYPGAGKFVNIYMDSGAGDVGFVVAADYGAGPAYKTLDLAGSSIILDANGTDQISITTSGPKFLGSNSVAVTAGAYNLSMAATSFPGVSGATDIPYAWLRFVTSGGTVVYVPAWR